MKPTRIAGTIGAALLAVSCHKPCPKPYVYPKVRAFETAARYMTKDEVAIMQRNAQNQIMDFSADVSEKIFFWDSILNKELVREAYLAGRNFVKDSLAGKAPSSRQFSLPLDTVISIPRRGTELLNEIKLKTAEYVGGEAMYKLNQIEPSLTKNSQTGVSVRNNHTTHYYDLVGSVAAQRDAYNKGKKAVSWYHR